MKDSAQARDLYHQVMEDLNIPEEGLLLSKQQQLVRQLQTIYMTAGRACSQSPLDDLYILMN